MGEQQYQDFVLRTVEERDIRFIQLWFTDILGHLKHFAISPEDLEVAFEEGIGFDGSSVEGFTDREEADMLAFPDPSTFQVLPWRPSEQGVARVFCHLRTPDRKPYDGDVRWVLRRVFERAEAKNMYSNVGALLEYYHFKDTDRPEPLDRNGYFDLVSDDPARDLRRETVLMLEQMSVPTEYSFHNKGPSQEGVSLRHAEALTAADGIMTAKYVIQVTAHQAGVRASFMPKPLADEASSAMFLHQSLFDRDGNNLFWDGSDDVYHLSETARHYMAGLLRYAPEMMAITNPTVNSYKRITNSENDIPRFATWGLRNRAALVRIPTYKPGKDLSTRLELRVPDATCNPYLVNAVTLAAGLKGIEDGLELPEEMGQDFYAKSDEELVAEGYVRLPRSLDEALDRFESSELMREVLGDHICDYFLQRKRHEWRHYNASVSEWEVRHYL